VRSVLACLLIMLGLAAVSTQAAARSSGRFACAWRYSLFDGRRAGYVTAGNNATCNGQRGSLTLSTRLQEWNASTHRWRTVRFRHRTWTNLETRRSIEVAKRCDGGRYRATFMWLLRRDSRTMRHLARKGPIVAPVGCRIS
jgi:hypothetical protein